VILNPFHNAILVMRFAYKIGGSFNLIFCVFHSYTHITGIDIFGNYTLAVTLSTAKSLKFKDSSLRSE
jgi:hypothetical protein